MEKICCKKIKLKVKGYTLIESIVAVCIISISILLSIQLLSNPFIGQSHTAILDIETMADSLSTLTKKGMIQTETIINRPWGAMVVEVNNYETPRGYIFVNMYALTNFGTRIPVKKELYEIAE